MSAGSERLTGSIVFRLAILLAVSLSLPADAEADTAGVNVRDLWSARKCAAVVRHKQLCHNAHWIRGCLFSCGNLPALTAR